MAQPITPSRIDIDLRVLPHTCYRASDRARPRWRFLLAAINKSRRGLVLRGMTIVQRLARKRTQRTITGNALASALVQGSVELPSKGAIVLDVHEPADTHVAGTSVTVTLEFATRSGRKVSGRQCVGLTQSKTRYLRFPLEGEWLAANGRRDLHCAGTQFGFDFIHRDDLPLLEDPPKRRVPLRKFAAFGRPLYAPAAGEVVACAGNQPDLQAMLTGTTFLAGRPAGKPKTALLGNYVLLKIASGAHVMMAHMQRGSLRVAPGNRVEEGAHLGNVGNSGNTSGPHLHIEMLDGRPDFAQLMTLGFAGSGLPFGFRDMAVHPLRGTGRMLKRLVPRKDDIVSSPTTGR